MFNLKDINKPNRLSRTGQISCLIVTLLFILPSFLSAQEKKLERPETYRLGLDLGLNYNMIGLGYQDLSPRGGDFIDFHTVDGSGIGVYIGIRSEYISSSWWGVGLKAGYDNRGVLATDQTFSFEPEYDIYNSYININPFLKFNDILSKQTSVYVGPIFAIKMNGKMDFDPKDGSGAIEGLELTNLDGFTYGVSLGIGHDIRITNIGSNKVFVLAPFVEASWLMGQRPPKLDNQDSFDDTWTSVTARVGITGAIDFIPGLTNESTGGQYATMIPPYQGKVVQRVVEESFPLIPYVFFDQGSTTIPARYKLLSKSDAENFDIVDVLDLTNDVELKGESSTTKKLSVYHNILNIYANEMKEDNSLTVELIGSAPKSGDGNQIANEIKNYLINVHGIDGNRITTKGQTLPRIPSGSSATPVNDRPLADKENRRVEFVFSDDKVYDLLEIKMVDEYPIDNDILVTVNPAVKFSSWNVVIQDENGQQFKYGPYFNQQERISPYEILKGKDLGEYSGKIEIVQNDGKSIYDESEFELEKVMDNTKTGERHTILFNYGQSDAVKLAEKDLRTQIAPKVDEDEKLIISGHTDPIGNTDVNSKISASRANEALTIFNSELSKNIAKNISAYGYGELNSSSTYNNDLPEGRMYNRNVTIDIVPMIK